MLQNQINRMRISRFYMTCTWFYFTNKYKRRHEVYRMRGYIFIRKGVSLESYRMPVGCGFIES